MGALIMLGGCTPLPPIPDARISPGPGKSIAAFHDDEAGCRAFAERHVTAPIFATPGEYRHLYDAAFDDCMFSLGDDVRGYAPIALQVTSEAPRRRDRVIPRPPTLPPADPVLVRDVQGELFRLNYLQSAPDGRLGLGTASAIKRFERGHGMTANASPSKALLERLQSTSAAPP